MSVFLTEGEGSNPIHPHQTKISRPKKGAFSKRTGKCADCGKEKAKHGIFGKYYCKECYLKRKKKGKEEYIKTCCKCDTRGKCFKHWGKYYCEKCLMETSGHGHSGMLAMPQEWVNHQLMQIHMIPKSYERPTLIYVPKGNKLFASLYLSHYPKSKGIVSRTLNYLVIYKGLIVGIIGGNSPPYSIKAVDEFFGITKENRGDMLVQFFNNEVFRIIRSAKNLATMTLKAFRYQVQKDYQEKYGCKLIGLITFVEPPRTGNIYKADNWKYLGKTKGYSTKRRGKRWHKRTWSRTIPKYIYGYKYRKVFKKENLNNSENK